jgi:hypothetical protein
LAGFIGQFGKALTSKLLAARRARALEGGTASPDRAADPSSSQSAAEADPKARAKAEKKAHKAALKRAKKGDA